MTGWVSILIPVITAVVTSILAGSLFRIRAERRQINAGAGKDEATTADILTGTALKMVTHAQDDAEHANSEVVTLRTELTAQRMLVEAANRDSAEAVRISVECAQEVMRQNVIIHVYEDFILAKGLPLPVVPK
jgi:uncharacterized protein involved in type VI secretion and phage assembly